MNHWAAEEGSPRPLGVTYVEDEQAYNFALYSKHASDVTLHLYSEDNQQNPIYSHHFDLLKNKSGRVWHCRVSATVLNQASYYGYQIYGPYNLQEGHRFDPGKILLDPYARTVYFPPDFSREAAIRSGSNAGKAPLGIIHTDHHAFDWSGDQNPRHTHDKAVSS